uniref:UDP-GalNAc:beta-1,3-N-acetylgalactosaminyltransferase 2 n=1 Tax=Petromyzon marinus TaxID=7757 RepID=A0AAJ7X4G1_PETMA|nr:UDP-GalNAc:beta-1,3-N-acetylgalactosaminyltransferase 2 isoform X2 [Petromyzon marinus]XP_032820718.1 UDP-GalNAc:beta-1,3-N-acetylgalactosaminyltransferase 2 isoform X2 [Petromyzon marinus]
MMDRRSLIPPLLCCLLSVVVVYRSRAGSVAVGRYELVVAILSARGNWVLRQAVRDSWLQAVTASPSLRKRVLPRFVVGSRACDIHPEDREDPYSCSFLNITLPASEREIEAVTWLEPGSPGTGPRTRVARPTLLGLDFRVRHPVVVTALGVFAWDGTVPNVTVRLHNAATRVVLAVAHFGALSPGVRVRACRYKPVQQFVLPKGFEGTVVWDGVTPADMVLSDPGDYTLDAGGGVLKFAATGRYGEVGDEFPEFRQERVALAGSFTFAVQDGGSLTAHASGRARRSAEWAETTRREAAVLRVESARHGDLVLVNVTDVYRSLPSKMLLFSRWAAVSLDFRLLLKTDDDSFVDVAEVLRSAVLQGYDQTPGLWWGSFRRNWAVDHAGKWAELSYPGPAYPAFACGAAYVLSADLVRWLSSNSDVLAAYQGEDVSMGVWMAALAPTRIQDNHRRRSTNKFPLVVVLPCRTTAGGATRPASAVPSPPRSTRQHGSPPCGRESSAAVTRARRATRRASRTAGARLPPPSLTLPRSRSLTPPRSPSLALARSPSLPSLALARPGPLVRDSRQRLCNSHAFVQRPIVTAVQNCGLGRDLGRTRRLKGAMVRGRQ